MGGDSLVRVDLWCRAPTRLTLLNYIVLSTEVDHLTDLGHLLLHWLSSVASHQQLWYKWIMEASSRETSPPMVCVSVNREAARARQLGISPFFKHWILSNLCSNFINQIWEWSSHFWTKHKPNYGAGVVPKMFVYFFLPFFALLLKPFLTQRKYYGDVLEHLTQFRVETSNFGHLWIGTHTMSTYAWKSNILLTHEKIYRFS